MAQKAITFPVKMNGLESLINLQMYSDYVGATQYLVDLISVNTLGWLS